VAPFAIGLVLGGCVAVPPPGPGAPPPPRASAGGGSYEAEYRRLQRLAEERLEMQRERVERIARNLLAAMPDPPRVQFVVIPGDPSVNAGATFGQVAVTAGMLKFVESDDELAVVLGHELAHVTEGHVTKGVIGGLALNVLAIIADVKAPGAGQAVGGIGQLFLNRFTQSQEREADEVGIAYAYRAGYDPRAAVTVQEKLAVEVPQTMAAGYFDTHPSSVERAMNAKRRADQLLAGGDPPGRERILAEIRSAERRERDLAGEVPDDGGYAIGSSARSAPPAVREPASRGAEPSFAGPAESDACARARVYREMANDAADPGERDALLERARRACP
jgi:metalloendopeptidase OMA1, mitochondrial